MAIAAVLTAVGCKEKAKPKDQAASVAGSGSGSQVGSAAGSGSGAADPGAGSDGPIVFNRLDVERYDEEKPVDFVKRTIKAGQVAAYRSLPTGNQVAAIALGTEVVQLSTYRGFSRVTFPDPEKPTQRLMGWVADQVFEDPPKLAKKYDPARCQIFDARLGTQAYALENDYQKARCEYVCKDDSECVNIGAKCEPRMFIERMGGIPQTLQYTWVCSLPDEVVSTIPELIGNVPPTSTGRCPFGQMIVPKYGPMCYRFCKKDVECPQGSTCRTFESLKVKSKLCST